jgi:translation initiation factor 2B subunit (eIF-2B alpha/beta/delta family)
MLFLNMLINRIKNIFIFRIYSIPMHNKKRFNRIISDIQKIKIQGARSIAHAALYAYSLIPTPRSKKELEHARPTEPMLVNVLRNYEKLGYRKTLAHFDESQKKINHLIFRLIKQDSVIFTHCHSTNVINSLIYAKRHRKKFQVYNTETRPLFQGRKTASELEKAGIKVTMFIDAGADIALERKQGTRKADIILLGADAILKEGVINKVGSGMVAELAHLDKIPLYVVADSWKYSSHHIPIEERDFHEVWKNAPRHIKVRNPAFEKVEKKYIKAIVSDLGILSYSDFLRKVHKK